MRKTGIKTTEEFIKKSKEIFGEDRFDYSKTEFIDDFTEVILICKKHNREFKQRAIYHINGTLGCIDCLNELRSEQKRADITKLIEKAKVLHNNKYDYSHVNYINYNTPVEIICPIHGPFYQSFGHHLLRGHGCPECNGGVTLTTEEFIKRARAIHGDRYDYSKVNYVRSITNVEIVCRLHGSFFQSPHNHLSESAGCPKCSSIGISKLENEVEEFLISNNIQYFSQHTWDWLIFDKNQKVDFYLPEFNVVIECQGFQHFKEIDHFGDFQIIQDRDINKDRLCYEHGIKIYYFSNLFKTFQTKPGEFIYPYPVFEDINTLFTLILSEFNLNYNYNPIRLIGP